MYVNADKVGKTHIPLRLPKDDENNEKQWEVKPKMKVSSPLLGKTSPSTHQAPFLLIGCDIGQQASDFKDYCQKGSAFDELAIWTRELEVNRTHNEIEYFLGGYGKFQLRSTNNV